MKYFQTAIIALAFCLSSTGNAKAESKIEPGVWFSVDAGGYASGWVKHESGAWMTISCNERGKGSIELMGLPLGFESAGLVDVQPSELGGVHHHWFSSDTGSLIADLDKPIASTFRYIPTKWEVKDAAGETFTIAFGTEGYDKARIETLHFCGLLYQGWAPHNEGNDK